MIKSSDITTQLCRTLTNPQRDKNQLLIAIPRDEPLESREGLSCWLADGTLTHRYEHVSDVASTLADEVMRLRAELQLSACKSRVLQAQLGALGVTPIFCKTESLSVRQCESASEIARQQMPKLIGAAVETFVYDRVPRASLAPGARIEKMRQLVKEAWVLHRTMFDLERELEIAWTVAQSV